MSIESNAYIFGHITGNTFEAWRLTQSHIWYVNGYNGEQGAQACPSAKYQIASQKAHGIWTYIWQVIYPYPNNINRDTDLVLPIRHANKLKPCSTRAHNVQTIVLILCEQKYHNVRPQFCQGLRLLLFVFLHVHETLCLKWIYSLSVFILVGVGLLEVEK